MTSKEKNVFSNGDQPATERQLGYIKGLKEKLGDTSPTSPDLTKANGSNLIEALQAKEETHKAQNNEVKQSFEGVNKTNGETPAVKIGMIEKLVLKHFSRRNEALPTAQAFIKTCNYMLALCNAWEESLK